LRFLACSSACFRIGDRVLAVSSSVGRGFFAAVDRAGSDSRVHWCESASALDVHRRRKLTPASKPSAAVLRYAAPVFDARYIIDDRGLDCAPIRGEDPAPIDNSAPRASSPDGHATSWPSGPRLLPKPSNASSFVAAIRNAPRC
jgi:hypothetical protein